MTTKTVRLSLNVLTAMMLWPGLFAGLVRAADAPKIQFDRTIQDLGIVIEGEVPGGKFVFQNTGTGVLELSKPETSCGCTVATVKPEKLAPGEKGEISFTLDLTNMRGPTEKSITVPSNDPETPQALLLIKADIKPIFEFSPEILFFDEMQAGKTVKGEIKIKRIDGKKLNITKVAAKEFVTVKIEPDEKSQGQSARLLVEVKAEGPPGIFSDMLRLYMDNAAKANLLIPIAGQLLGGLKLEPETLVWNLPDPAHWPGPNPDATTIRTLIVSSMTDRSFELQDVESDLEDLLVKVAPLEKGKKYQVMLKLDQAHKESTEGVLNFETTLPTQPTLQVPIKINVAKPPNKR